jgi:hypothetical protein
MSAEQLIYSIKDTCKLFSISESTFWKWAADDKFGELIKVGRRTYVKREAILKLTGGA